MSAARRRATRHSHLTPGASVTINETHDAKVNKAVDNGGSKRIVIYATQQD